MHFWRNILVEIRSNYLWQTIFYITKRKKIMTSDIKRISASEYGNTTTAKFKSQFIRQLKNLNSNVLSGGLDILVATGTANVAMQIFWFSSKIDSAYQKTIEFKLKSGASRIRFLGFQTTVTVAMPIFKITYKITYVKTVKIKFMLRQ